MVYILIAVGIIFYGVLHFFWQAFNFTGAGIGDVQATSGLAKNPKKAAIFA